MGNLPQLSQKDLIALRLAAMENPGGLYPGMQWDSRPKRFERLRQMGLVDSLHPHNPVHRARAVITPRGREILERSQVRS